MLYEMESPWAGDARGVSFGRIFTQDGRLVMTVAQEALMRLHSARRT
jgi:acyl-CoA thioesterase-2